jgi:hypothetical protein
MHISLYIHAWVVGWARAGGRAGRAGKWVGGMRQAGAAGGRADRWVGGRVGCGRRARAWLLGWMRQLGAAGGRAGGRAGGWVGVGNAVQVDKNSSQPFFRSHFWLKFLWESCASLKGCLERSRHAMAKKKKKQSASMKSASITADRKARAWESAAGFVGASFENAQVLAVEMIDEMLQVMAVILPDLVLVGLQAFVNEHLSSEIRARQKVNITTERRVSKNDLAGLLKFRLCKMTGTSSPSF